MSMQLELISLRSAWSNKCCTVSRSVLLQTAIECTLEDWKLSSRVHRINWTEPRMPCSEDRSSWDKDDCRGGCTKVRLADDCQWPCTGLHVHCSDAVDLVQDGASSFVRGIGCVSAQSILWPRGYLCSNALKSDSRGTIPLDNDSFKELVLFCVEKLST